jgi:potassium channel LctB
MARSLFNLLRVDRSEYLIFSWEHFLILLFVYFVLIFGFTIVYLGLGIIGFKSVLIHDFPQDSPTIAYIGNLLYFSTMTILTVGYGDITPLGFAKLIASIQALIGYLLPAAFLVSGIASSMEQSKKG